MRTHWRTAVTLAGSVIQIAIWAVVILLIGVWVSQPVRTHDQSLAGFGWMAARSLAFGFVFACGCLTSNWLDRKDCSACISEKPLFQIVILLTLVYGGIFLVSGGIWVLVWLMTGGYCTPLR